MENKEFDLIIIGAGPAGLTAAQYGARSNLSTLLIDETMPGGQVNQIFNLENYPGVFPAVNGMEFVEKMESQAKAFGAEIIQAQVASVDLSGGKYTVKTSKNEFVSSALVLASGAEHRKLGVKGEAELSGRGVSYCATCDGPFFRNRRIVVIGGGDSACSEALYLATLSDKVTIVHRKSQFRAQKAVADQVLNNPNITSVFNSAVTEIQGDMKVTGVELTDTVTGEKSVLEADGVFIFVGMVPRTELFCTLKTDEGGYIVTNEKMETGVPGLYVAGDIRSKPFRQIVTACSDGAIAAHQAEEYVRELRNEVYK